MQSNDRSCQSLSAILYIKEIFLLLRFARNGEKSWSDSKMKFPLIFPLKSLFVYTQILITRPRQDRTHNLKRFWSLYFYATLYRRNGFLWDKRRLLRYEQGSVTFRKLWQTDLTTDKPIWPIDGPTDGKTD